MPGCASGSAREIYILTGRTGSGKSSFLIDLVEKLRKHRLRISGFVAPSVFENNASRSYELLDLSTGITIPLASGIFREGWSRYGRFFFNPEALSRGRELLMDPEIDENNLVILDELGPFELEGQLWADAATLLLHHCTSSLIWVVRDHLLDAVIRKWQLNDPLILDINIHNSDQAREIILSHMQAG